MCIRDREFSVNARTHRQTDRQTHAQTPLKTTPASSASLSPSGKNRHYRHLCPFLTKHTIGYIIQDAVQRRLSAISGKNWTTTTLNMQAGGLLAAWYIVHGRTVPRIDRCAPPMRLKTKTVDMATCPSIRYPTCIYLSMRYLWCWPAHSRRSEVPLIDVGPLPYNVCMLPLSTEAKSRVRVQLDGARFERR